MRIGLREDLFLLLRISFFREDLFLYNSSLGPARSLCLNSDVREVGVAQVDLFDRRPGVFAESDRPHPRAEVGRDVHLESVRQSRSGSRYLFQDFNSQKDMQIWAQMRS